jgi:hypothetical protein
MELTSYDLPVRALSTALNELLGKGAEHACSSLCKKDLPKVQDRSPQRCGARDLLRGTSQTASRLILLAKRHVESI